MAKSGKFRCIKGRLGDVPDDEIEAAITELQRRKDLRDQIGIDFDHVRSDTAEGMRLAKEAAELSEIERWSAYNNAVIRKANDERQARLKGMGKVASFFYGTNTNFGVKGSKESFEASWNDMRRRLLSGFYYDMQKAGLWKLVQTQDRAGRGVLDDLIAREMHELRPGGSPGITKNVEARKIADLMAKYNEEARGLQNLYGGFIRKIHGYIIAQSHDALRIKAAGARKWAEDIVDLLEDSNFGHLTMRPGADADTVRAGRVNYLMKTWEELANGKFGPDIEDDPALAAFRGPGNLARKISKHRAFHFKDAEAFLAYNKLYGAASITEGFIGGLEKAAQNAALLQTFGTNPRHEMKRLYQNAQRQAFADGDDKTATALSDDFDKSQVGQWADFADGSADVPGNLVWARRMSTLRNFQAWSSLGGAGLTSLFGDTANAMVALRYNGKNWFESLFGHYGDMFAQAASAGSTSREFAAMTGVAADSAIYNMVTRLDAYGDYAHRWAKRWSNLFFKINLLQGVTQFHERAMEAQLGTLLGLASKHSLDKMPNKDLARELGAYGITGEMWEVLRKHTIHEFEGRPMMVPGMVRTIDDATIAKLARDMNLGDKPSKRLIARARSELQAKIGGYLASETYSGVIRLGIRERAALTQGTRPGTLTGEGLRLIGQFKGYPTAVITRVLGRMVHEDKMLGVLGQLGRSAASGATLGAFRFGAQGEGRRLGQYMLTMMGLGYISMIAADTFKGLTPRPADDPRTWTAAMLRGGGMGLFGDYLFGQSNHFGSDVVDQIAGPTLSDVGRLSTILAKSGRYAVGDSDFADTEISNFLTQNTPGVNLFYTRAPLNYLLLYDLQEALSPGVLRRIERRAEEGRGQEFFYNPSENRLRPFTEGL